MNIFKIFKSNYLFINVYTICISLNPIAIEIVSAKAMPPKPTTNKINYATIAQTYIYIYI